jgi:hypothetical protein
MDRPVKVLRLREQASVQDHRVQEQKDWLALGRFLLREQARQEPEQKDLLQWARDRQGQEQDHQAQEPKDQLVRRPLLRQVQEGRDFPLPEGYRVREQVLQVQVQKGWPALGRFLLQEQLREQLRERLAVHLQDQEVAQEVAP